MKTIRILLGAMSVIAVTSLSAYADSSIVTVYNGHGQSNQLYRDNDTSVALYAGGTAAGSGAACSSSQCGEYTLQTIDKGHNQPVYLYRQNE